MNLPFIHNRKGGSTDVCGEPTKEGLYQAFKISTNLASTDRKRRMVQDY